MRMKSIISIIVLITILSIIGCKETTKQDTPMLASLAMKTNMTHLGYHEFINITMEGNDTLISEEQFNEIKGLMTDKSGHETYHLLKFDNGEMILVEFASIPDGGEFKIQGIKIIPDEMKDFFK
ncbi:MAG: hypothetical protein GX053_04865 [Tissierella sp.]|nr:hypothetical protein [Tissierella sp.]